MNYWLMKSEPDAYSIDDLKKDKKTLWDGIRNYQARNFMMKDMQIGDQVLFYHSNAKPPGIVGLGEISKQAMPDPTQFDKKSNYFDAKSSKENPRWHCVEVKYKDKFKSMLSLNEIKEVKPLKDMMVIKKGARLSIQPVDKKDFNYILKTLG
ncbi:MAG: EVE domain-containing protein [Bdellovibrionaceae bacterium]|jgi:predicted RNA-binding protein with PUA-like domain|nr:EVE domain-containing protein [Pseudobdellovibrionaceae bacterium]